MISYRADWLLPISDSPLAGGSVSLADGRIVAVDRDAREDAVDLGRVAILPGLVNAHTHLELSYLRGAIPPAPSFGQWVRAVMTMRQQYSDPADPRIVEPVRRAIDAARLCGTALVGDVSNTLVTVPMLRDAGMPAQVFYELLGFTELDPEGRVRAARARVDDLAPAKFDVRVSLAPHAPYSVSAGLFQAIRGDLDAHPDAVSSVHLGEPPEEIELLRHGTGAIRSVLEDLGRWPSDWRPPGVSPVAFLADLGVLDARMLVVHGVQFDGEDLTTLRSIGATVVSCPRSNLYVGVGPPPLEVFYAMDVDVAFGTDSLASVADLNVFAELAEARRLAPRVRARCLLESATLTGARALGREREFGSIEAGKRASLIAVRVPAGVSNVEEYLVGGVEPSAISWLDGANSL